MNEYEEEMDIVLKKIGVVHTSSTDDQVRERIGGQESKIEIFQEYEEALDGLLGFSHVFVLSYFDRLRPEQIGPLKVKPRGLLRYGIQLEELPLIGVFALDSPTRPNPIGLSLVPLVKLEGTTLTVTDLDLFNKTPVLDIKPYQASYRIDKYELPSWHKKLAEKAGHV